MKIVLTIATIMGASALSMTNAFAQAADCRPCAYSASHSECVKCARANNPGTWTEPQMRNWCTRNMRACSKKR